MKVSNKTMKKKQFNEKTWISYEEMKNVSSISSYSVRSQQLSPGTGSTGSTGQTGNTGHTWSTGQTGSSLWTCGPDKFCWVCWDVSLFWQWEITACAYDIICSSILLFTVLCWYCWFCCVWLQAASRTNKSVCLNQSRAVFSCQSWTFSPFLMHQVNKIYLCVCFTVASEIQNNIIKKGSQTSNPQIKQSTHIKWKRR